MHPLHRPTTFIFMALLLTILAHLYTPAHAQWNDPSGDQFHIQTDEGDERYFRYQTHNGQYRKEKRLADGTVVGSYGWIDSDGMLRLRDYIADNAGYRILRTKNVFVGRDRPISQAIKVAKKVPSSAGELTKHNAPPQLQPVSVTPAPYSPAPAAVPPTQLYLPSTTPSPLDLGYISSSRPSLFSSTTPSPFEHNYLGTSTVAPSYADSGTPGTVIISPKPSYFASTTPSSASVYDLPQQHHHAHTPNAGFYYEATSPASVYQSEAIRQPSSTIAPVLDSNALDYAERGEVYDGTSINSYRFQNGPTYPLTQHGHTFTGANHLGNGYDPQYAPYDGVSVTNDGFRYYIPRAYHEEQRQPQTGAQSGSFGYIDPFGIRRVVYYNAGADGFKHRKNNRYVGFDATPYDPRPY